MGIASDLVYVVLAALIGGIFARILGQPLVLGYILGGVLIGPYTGGPTVSGISDIEKLAEIGVALLLFALGLEFSLRDLRRLAKIIFIGTPIQMGLSSVAGFYIASWLHLPLSDSLWFGAIISLSSTMVVLKSLQSKDSLDSEFGRIMMGVLIAQDLAVIPLILILPQISGEHWDYGAILAAAGKSVAFVVAMYYIGTRALPRIFSAIAAWGPRELFLVCTLAVAFGVGMASHALGLSFAFGAFIAGMILSETDFSHQALSDISGLRELFGLVFFVSVGMLLDPAYCLANWQIVLTAVVAVVCFKSLACGIAVRIIGYKGVAPWAAGLGLSQVGEFAFLVAQTGSRSGAIQAETHSLLIAIAVLSMFFTPGLLTVAPWLYGHVSRLFSRHGEPGVINPSFIARRDHVVIIGAGAVGRRVAQVFLKTGVDHVLVEMDFRTGNELRDKRSQVIFGDASHHMILEASGLKDAKLVVVTTTNIDLTARILSEIRELNPNIPVIARVQEMEDSGKLNRFAVSGVVEPQREAALEILRQGMGLLGFEPERIQGLLVELRQGGSAA